MSGRDAMLPAGIHTISADAYHADPAPEPSLSNSIACVLANQTPIQAWLKHPRLNPDYQAENSGTFDIGEACHGLLLEGQDRVCIIDTKDWKTDAAKEARNDAWANGRIPLLREQYKKTLLMRDAALRFAGRSRTLRGVFESGKPEQTLIWQAGETWCRARLDLLVSDRPLILDYKSTAAPDPGTWTRRYIVEHGYDMQSVWYRRGLSALAGEYAEFYFLVQEVRPPYLCYLVEPTESMHQLGSIKVERALHLWRTCLACGDWPGYPTEPFLADAPSWALQQEELQL